MGLKEERAHFAGEHSAFIAWPEHARTPLPAVLVLQEAWGLDLHIEDMTRRMAKAGYVAFAPDLYAKNGARPAALSRERMAELQAFLNQAPPFVWQDPKTRDAELAKRPKEERERLGESMTTMMAGMKLDAYVPALLAAASYLRDERPESRGQKVGALGFCMGGGIVAQLACHDPKLAAAAIFYGSPAPEALIPDIRCPVIAFYGSEDKRLMDSLPAFTEAMRGHGKRFEPHVYPGVPHAFSNDDRPSYNAVAARHSLARLLSFFDAELS